MLKLLIIVIIVIIALIYLVGAVITYGIEFAYWQNIVPEYADEDYKQDRRVSIVMGILWPFMIFDSYVRSNFISSFKKSGMKFK